MLKKIVQPLVAGFALFTSALFAGEAAKNCCAEASACCAKEKSACCVKKDCCKDHGKKEQLDCCAKDLACCAAVKEKK